MAPYGERSPLEVHSLVLAHAARLLSFSKALVLACNTATAVAIEALRARYPNTPIIGMEPAIKPALAVAPHPKILILATKATLGEARLTALLARHAARADFIRLPAPGLVRLVEKGLADSPQADAYLAELLSPFQGEGRPDAVVLGCTHFPFAKAALLRFFGTRMPFFDGAVGTAAQAARCLRRADLCNPQEKRGTLTLTASAPHALPLYGRLLKQT